MKILFIIILMKLNIKMEETMTEINIIGQTITITMGNIIIIIGIMQVRVGLIVRIVDTFHGGNRNNILRMEMGAVSIAMAIIKIEVATIKIGIPTMEVEIGTEIGIGMEVMVVVVRMELKRKSTQSLIETKFVTLNFEIHHFRIEYLVSFSVIKFRIDARN